MQVHYLTLDENDDARPLCGSRSRAGGWAQSPLSSNVDEVQCARCRRTLGLQEIVRRSRDEVRAERMAAETLRLEQWVGWVEEAAQLRHTLYIKGFDIALAHPSLVERPDLVSRLRAAFDTACATPDVSRRRQSEKEKEAPTLALRLGALPQIDSRAGT